MIESNFENIKKSLSDMIRKNQNYSKYLGRPSDIISEGLSYIPEVTMEYNPELRKSQQFHDFVAHRCVLRLIDEYRTINRNIRNNRGRVKAMEEVSERLTTEKGFASEEDIRDKMKEKGFENLKKYRVLKPVTQPLSKGTKQMEAPDKSVSQSEWEDLRLGIINKADEYFKELPGESNLHRNQSCKACKVLVKDYLIPKSEGSFYKNLEDIALELGLTEGRLSQMINGDRMKRFFTLFYDELKEQNA